MPRVLRSPVLAAALLCAASLASAAGFTLTSPTIKPGATLADAQVFNGFGCSGKNVSPELKWSGAPAGTKSFAVTVYDPDAPTGSGWWHWVVYNLPADGKGLPAGAVQGRTDFGANAFGGACPPQGDKPHPSISTVAAMVTPKSIPVSIACHKCGQGLARGPRGGVGCDA